jgi:asparagine synthase (glutamine-hydrolysing)
MCGICGIVTFNNQSVQETPIKKMMHIMKHRGPDDEGIFIEDNVGLGFVRLSIIDLTTAGHQPMISEDKRYVIVFNGEIYNYIELREELKKEGYSFKTKTDSEVLLTSFIHWGEECLHLLNGMWAFVIYDRVLKKIFAARDRFGIKPFYYYCDNERLIFSSEIPPILEVMVQKPVPNEQSLYNYLVFNRLDYTDTTFFENIIKLPHSHTLTIAAQQVIRKRWYNLSDHIHNPFECYDEFRELLSSAIGLRLRSDVPVGVCLSGGLDSSSIVSLLLKDHHKYDLNTFSAVYGGEQVNKGREWKVDETSYIQEYSGQLKNMFYITPTSQSLIEDLIPFIRVHAEPVASTAPYAQYKVMELAREHVVVTLDGQGGDEQLAGYHYFFGVLFKELLYQLRLSKLIKEIFSYRNMHNSNFGLKMFLFFLLPLQFKTLLRSSTRGYIRSDFLAMFKNQDNLITDALYGARSLQNSLVNHFDYKLEHLLKWEDRNSMRFSIEARVPFLDYRLVEKTLSMKSSDKISQGVTKRILRESMQHYLPEKIRNRKDEVGFDTPEDTWFRTKEFEKLILEIIHSSSFIGRPYLDSKKVHSLYAKHLKGEINISRDIWKWINLELWFREFID